jgi:hypothetical protein
MAAAPATAQMSSARRLAALARLRAVAAKPGPYLTGPRAASPKGGSKDHLIPDSLKGAGIPNPVAAIIRVRVDAGSLRTRARFERT